VSKLAIIGSIEVAPEQRERLLSALTAHTRRCLKDEPGTLQMDILLPRDEDAKVLLYEVYRDDEAFETHRQGASIARFHAESGGVKVQVTRCSLVEGGGKTS
jgi:quinol monooxygenase YgiN